MSKNCSLFHRYLPNVTFVKLPRLGFHADLSAEDIYICNIRKQTPMLPQAFWEGELCLYLLLKWSVLATDAWLAPPLSGVAQLVEHHRALDPALWKGRQRPACPLELPPSCYSGLLTWGAACSAVQINAQCQLSAGQVCVFAYAQNYLFPLQFLSFYPKFTHSLNYIFSGEPILQEFSPVQNPRALAVLTIHLAHLILYSTMYYFSFFPPVCSSSPEPYPELQFGLCGAL